MINDEEAKSKDAMRYKNFEVKSFILFCGGESLLNKKSLQTPGYVVLKMWNTLIHIFIKSLT